MDSNYCWTDETYWEDVNIGYIRYTFKHITNSFINRGKLVISDYGWLVILIPESALTVFCHTNSFGESSGRAEKELFTEPKKCLFLKHALVGKCFSLSIKHTRSNTFYCYTIYSISDIINRLYLIDSVRSFARCEPIWSNKFISQ